MFALVCDIQLLVYDWSITGRHVLSVDVRRQSLGSFFAASIEIC